MNKPQMQKRIGIKKVDGLYVFLDTDQNTADNLKDFGRVTAESNPNSYLLQIDARFVVDEVIAYIDWLNEEAKPKKTEA